MSWTAEAAGLTAAGASSDDGIETDDADGVGLAPVQDAANSATATLAKTAPTRVFVCRAFPSRRQVGRANQLGSPSLPALWLVSMQFVRHQGPLSTVPSTGQSCMGAGSARARSRRVARFSNRGTRPQTAWSLVAVMEGLVVAVGLSAAANFARQVRGAGEATRHADLARRERLVPLAQVVVQDGRSRNPSRTLEPIDGASCAGHAQASRRGTVPHTRPR